MLRGWINFGVPFSEQPACEANVFIDSVVFIIACFLRILGFFSIALLHHSQSRAGALCFTIVSRALPPWSLIGLNLLAAKSPLGKHLSSTRLSVIRGCLTSAQYLCCDSLVYPGERQWKIENTCIPIDEMRHPKTFDRNNSPALSVLKRGRTTGVTCGVANEVESYVRTYFPENRSFESKEWAIIGYDKTSPFSVEGDSGALVVDAEGRMGGMLTGGSGSLETTDVTYATPIVALLQDMHKHGWKRPNPNVAP